MFHQAVWEQPCRDNPPSVYGASPVKNKPNQNTANKFKTSTGTEAVETCPGPSAGPHVLALQYLSIQAGPTWKFRISCSGRRVESGLAKAFVRGEPAHPVCPATESIFPLASPKKGGALVMVPANEATSPKS